MVDHDGTPPEEKPLMGIKVVASSDAIGEAWGIIANAHDGHWEDASPEWRAAAERWRDKYITYRDMRQEFLPVEFRRPASDDEIGIALAEARKALPYEYGNIVRTDKDGEVTMYPAIRWKEDGRVEFCHRLGLLFPPLKLLV